MRVITDKLTFPEGPIAFSDGSVMVVDIIEQTLVRVSRDGDIGVVAKVPGGPNGAAVGPDGKIFICNNGGMDWVEEQKGRFRPALQSSGYTGGSIDVVNPADGSVRRLYDRCSDNQLRGPNDLVFDGDGGFWFTDMGKRRPREMDLGFVYWAASDGSEIKEVISGLITPNGIALSPDGKTLYVAETIPGRIWAYPVIGPGEVRKQPWPSPAGGILFAGPGGRTRFDGLAVAESGAVYAAALDMCAILEFTGDLKSHVVHPIPDLMVTNLCFGGSDMNTCYVTLSHEGRLAAFDWHEAGLKLNYQS